MKRKRTSPVQNWRTVVLVLCAVLIPTVSIGATGTATSDTGTATTKKLLALGDGHSTTTGAKTGWIYACRIMTGGGGATGATPWIVGQLWDPTQKPSVEGAHTWSEASVKITTSSTERIITTTGVPVNATTGTFPIATTDPAYAIDRNPNTITPAQRTVRIPKNPKLAAKASCLSLGAIGYSVNGVALYNGLDGENRDAVAHEMQDSCGGHPERSGQYHYHSGSPCLLRDATTSSTLIGYALDGFGIYVERDSSGELLTNAALDTCHGRTSSVVFNGTRQTMYHYVVTAEYPYTIGCYRGTPATTSTTPTSTTPTQPTPPSGAIAQPPSDPSRMPPPPPEAPRPPSGMLPPPRR